jgi:hypothetical protein
MSSVHLVLGVTVCSLFLLTALWGGWLWRTNTASTAYWAVLRTAQGALVAQVVLGGALLATGKEPADLHVLYGLLPLGVSFAAEQLRLTSAETVLQELGFESAQAVGDLPEESQRTVVFAIVRREVGIMALASVVVFGLAIRAAAVSGHLL